MVLDEVEIDDEDIAEALIAMERSFGITFPQDLTHVRTAGDLFDEIVKRRSPTEDGDRCDTAVTFFLLRRSLAAQGLEERARPSLSLLGQSLGSPRKAKKRLERETGLQLPPVPMATRGCVLMVLFAVLGLGLPVYGYWALAMVALAGIVITASADRGAWTGDWETLGSLTRATAIRNVMRLGVRGARSHRRDWWRSFSALLVDSTSAIHEKRFVEADEIGPATRFRFT